MIVAQELQDILQRDYDNAFAFEGSDGNVSVVAPNGQFLKDALTSIATTTNCPDLKHQAKESLTSLKRARYDSDGQRVTIT